MKITPEEQAIAGNFQPGVLSKDGFLGKDTRHVHDIVHDDMMALSEMGVTRDDLADRLQYFIDLGKTGLEEPVPQDCYVIQIRWDRGRIVCPFAHPGGVYPLIHATLTNTKTGKTMCYSQLSVHLIRKHGFFGGIGSVFRINPADAAELPELPK